MKGGQAWRSIIVEAVNLFHCVRYFFGNEEQFVFDLFGFNGAVGLRIHVFGDVYPLMSFKESLLSLPVIINKQENIRLSNKYLNDGSFVSQVNEFNTSYNFPGGFSDSPVYILICAGG